MDNQALTLEIYREKLYFGEKSIVCITSLFFDLNPSKVKLKIVYFSCCKFLKKEIFMHGMNLNCVLNLNIMSACLVNYHDIFETYESYGYRASTM